MRIEETPAAEGLPRDYSVLPSAALFTERRTVRCDDVTWYYAVARADDGSPAFVGVWRPIIGEGYRLPCANRPLRPIFEIKAIQEWLADVFGEDSTIVQIPQTPEECHYLIALDHPYKN